MRAKGATHESFAERVVRDFLLFLRLHSKPFEFTIEGSIQRIHADKSDHQLIQGSDGALHTATVKLPSREINGLGREIAANRCGIRVLTIPSSLQDPDD